MPSPRTKWRFALVNSNDMSRIGLLRAARDRKVDVRANKPGSGGFSYPMDGAYSAEIVPYSTGIIAERFNWRATAALNTLGTYGDVWDEIWSGYVLTIDEDWSNNKMSVGCVGWLQRLHKRLIREDITWTGIDDGVIIRDIIQSINGAPAGPSYEFAGGTTQYTADDDYVVEWPAGSSPNTSSWIKWGGTQPNQGAGGATAYTTATRNFKVIKYQGDALSPIDQLVGIENGCDIVTDPVTRAVTVHRRYERIKDDVIIGFRWGPKNVSQFNRNIDADQAVNYILVTGDAASIPAYVDESTSIADIGLVEETIQLSGVTGAGPGDTANPVLLAYAGAEILIRSSGIVTYAISPFTYSPGGSAPEPFIDYRIGDTIRVTALNPPRAEIINQAVRVFGMSISIDDNDNEILGQLELSP